MRALISRHPRASVLTGLLAVCFTVFVLVYFEPQTLLFDTEVNEAAVREHPGRTFGHARAAGD